jgi:hypothetical protein
MKLSVSLIDLIDFEDVEAKKEVHFAKIFIDWFY